MVGAYTFLMKILHYPHPALRAKCRPLTGLNAEVADMAARMLDLMHQSEGLGLAAPQVGLDFQMIVMTFGRTDEDKGTEVVAINPVIVESKGAFKDREGCLSFPGLYQDIRRAKTVKVQFYNLKGELQEMTASDLGARLWQHEIDHLNGTLFIDKMGPIAKLGSRKDLETLIYEFEKDVKKGNIPAGTVMKL
ncbi:MAG: peptide deformylase [Gemmataceae bacterium]